MKVRIESGDKPYDTKVFVDDEDVTMKWWISGMDMRFRAMEMPTITMEIQPYDIQYEGEAHIICYYIDPVTGETFTHDAALPPRDAS